MPVQKSSVQILWDAGSYTKSISSSSNATSDAHTLSSTAVSAMLTLKADYGASASSSDTIDFYLLFTTGDPDGAGADEYDTTGHGMHVATLSLSTDDPSQKTVEIPVSAKGFKLYAVNNSSSSTMTVSAEIYQTLIA